MDGLVLIMLEKAVRGFHNLSTLNSDLDIPHIIVKDAGGEDGIRSIQTLFAMLEAMPNIKAS